MKIPTREELAQIIYENSPYYEGGDYIDGFQVSPGGNLSWEQVKSRAAEFTEYEELVAVPYKTADAILLALNAS